MNFHFIVVIDENDKITLYSNVSPVGIEWEETKMGDYILKYMRIKLNLRNFRFVTVKGIIA